ncbi:C-X-C motif chemokine 10-like [Plectropomus leopardus]|uniref:C-X-C motif chemokine 10-like n=1 Tax=Plectropomus leopardus TaxID=160734 RepID=UPI001C4D3FA8|nr:C-X-C motif chemokine 10-like [Plectropomus leopardus]
MSFITIVAVLVFLTIPEGISLDHAVVQRCRCISKEKQPIGRYIATVEVQPPSSHCKDTEIIATLKRDGTKVCLDPNAPWVKKVLERKTSEQTS